MSRRLQQSVGTWVCVVMLIGLLVNPARAGMKEIRGQASPAVGAGQRPLEKPGTKHGASSGGTARGLSGGEKKSQVVQRHKVPGTSSSRRSKTPRYAKVSRAPKAALTSPPSQRDLVAHGLLETPQRYDPRLSHRTVGIPAPQLPDVTHDHFLELDRNRDGHVDPVERAFGRLDMEHDFQPR